MPLTPEQRAVYGPTWREVSTFVRFERAGGRCECHGECKSPKHGATSTDARCTARHGVAHPVTGSTVVLTTAHLEHDPGNVDPDKLRAFCQACHLAYDRDRHAATRAANRAAAAAAVDTAGPSLLDELEGDRA